MIKELYKEVIHETSLNVSESRIDAVRKKSLTKSGCRVYEDGYIGIAGCYGEPTEDIWAMAEANLAQRVPYPYQPEINKVRTRDLREIQIDDEAFIKDMEEILTTLKKEYPDFILSNKIGLLETEVSLSNDVGLSYVNRDKTLAFEILVKHVDSANIFDTYIVKIIRTYDLEALLKESRSVLAAFQNKVELPTKATMPIILQQDYLLGKFYEALHGEAFARGASLFQDKMNQKIFSDDFVLRQNRSESNYHQPFFDLEGTTQEGDVYPLIKEGVIFGTYTDKKRAAEFSLPLTGAAGGEYDEVPSLSNPLLSVAPGGKTLKELLNGEIGILGVVLSGGDYTSSGDFASPVQDAYLTDGERLLGRLPEFTITGNLFQMFGDDYMGLSSDRPFMGEHQLVIQMKVVQ